MLVDQKIDVNDRRYRRAWLTPKGREVRARVLRAINAKGGGLIMGFAFGRHRSHLTFRADEIAQRYGAWHINTTDLDGTRRGCFECPDRGPEINAGVVRGLLADVEAVGGFEKLRRKRRSMKVNSPDAGRFIGRNVGTPNGDFTYVLDFIGGHDRN